MTSGVPASLVPKTTGLTPVNVSVLNNPQNIPTYASLQIYSEAGQLKLYDNARKEKQNILTQQRYEKPLTTMPHKGNTRSNSLQIKYKFKSPLQLVSW